MELFDGINMDDGADIFKEESQRFADEVNVFLNHGVNRESVTHLLNLGIRYRQDELCQRLVGMDDHEAFEILDAALDALEGAL